MKGELIHEILNFSSLLRILNFAENLKIQDFLKVLFKQNLKERNC